MALPPGLPPRFKLTPERRRNLEQTREVIVEARERIKLARQANLDVTEMETKIGELSAQVEGILRVYGDK